MNNCTPTLSAALREICSDMTDQECQFAADVLQMVEMCDAPGPKLPDRYFPKLMARVSELYPKPATT